MPDSLPTYPHHKQIVRYFKDYCDHFGVTEKIRFSTQVLNVEKTNDEKWNISFRSSPEGTPLYLLKSVDGDVQSELFDAVLVCNGHHSVPRWPEPFEGQEEFKGQIFHSHQYKDPFSPYNLVDKRVLVVGIGNSGVDIANELSRCSKQVYLSTRSGAWIFPKYIGGKAFDHVLSLNRAMRYCIPRQFYDKIGNLYIKMVINKTMGSMESWGLTPKGDPLNMHPTSPLSSIFIRIKSYTKNDINNWNKTKVSHELLHRVGTGTIRLRPNIKSIGSDFVVFEDGEKSKIDVIIFCTGYNISYPFLSDQLLPVQNNHVELFNYMLSPTLPPTLAIIGLIQPLGAIMPIAEMQSRVMAQIWLGKAGLPSKENLIKNIAEKKEYIAHRYLSRDRHTIQVDFDDFMDTLAAMIGCLPNIKKHIKLWKPLLFGPVWPTHYRLDGPFAWDGAADAIKKAYAQIDERPEKEASHYWVDED